jgi:virginiamycin A acetyltransferase
VEPYSIVVGNPVKLIRYRFDGELTSLLLKFKWWDKPVEEINGLIPILTNSDLEFVKNKIRELTEKVV